MNIKQLTVTDIPEIVKLHQLCLPHTTTSKLGVEYMTTLYRKLLLSPIHHLVLGMVEDDHIVGVLTVTNNLSWTVSHLSPSLGGFEIVNIAMQIVLGKISLPQVIKRWRFENIILHRFPQPITTILTLFTHPAYRRKGIAKILMKQAITWSKKQKSTTLFVDTEETNTIARQFYLSNGFAQKTTILGEVVLAIQL